MKNDSVDLLHVDHKYEIRVTSDVVCSGFMKDYSHRGFLSSPHTTEHSCNIKVSVNRDQVITGVYERDLFTGKMGFRVKNEELGLDYIRLPFFHYETEKEKEGVEIIGFQVDECEEESVNKGGVVENPNYEIKKVVVLTAFCPHCGEGVEINDPLDGEYEDIDCPSCQLDYSVKYDYRHRSVKMIIERTGEEEEND